MDFRRNLFGSLVAVLVTCALAPCLHASAQTARFVVTNDDNGAIENTSTLYKIAGEQMKSQRTLQLKQTHVYATGGIGDGDGYLEGQQQAIMRFRGAECLFISDATTLDIAAIDLRTDTLVGNFKGSGNEQVSPSGIALLPSENGKYFYAGYRPIAFGFASYIATFQLGAGCTLTFRSETKSFGLQGGGIEGMAQRGDILVVGYGDGSLESFRVSGAKLASNNDKQNSTGFLSQNNGFGPASVQITKDRHFAVFGDAVNNDQGPFTEIEVSDISSGKLSPTIDYGGALHSHGDLGPGLSSNSAILSWDEQHLYVSNPFSGQVTVLNFDPKVGAVSAGCMTAALRGFGTSFAVGGQVAAAGVGKGSDNLWLAESGNGLASGVGIIQVNFNGSSCTATEATASPAADPSSIDLKSLAAF